MPAKLEIKTRKDGVDGTQGGMLEGNSHDDGGIETVVVDSGQVLEVEGEEFIVKKDAMNDEDTRRFEGEEMTNREIVEEINNKKYLKKGGYICDWGNPHLNMIFGCGITRMEDGGEIEKYARDEEKIVATKKDKGWVYYLGVHGWDGEYFKSYETIEAHLKDIYGKDVVIEKRGEGGDGDYEDHLRQSGVLNSNTDALSDRLQEFDKNESGSISDEVRGSEEYKSAKKEFDVAFKELQEFNKNSPKEYKQRASKERREKMMKS